MQEKKVLQQVALPKDVYTGTATKLFDFLAETLAEFIRQQQEVGTLCRGTCSMFQAWQAVVWLLLMTLFVVQL